MPYPCQMKYLHFPTSSQPSLWSSITNTWPGDRQRSEPQRVCWFRWFTWAKEQLTGSEGLTTVPKESVFTGSFEFSWPLKSSKRVFFFVVVFCIGSAETGIVGMVLWALHPALWSLNDLSRTGGLSDWLASLERPTLPHWLGHMELHISRTAALATLIPTASVLSVGPQQDIVLNLCSKLRCSSCVCNNCKRGC